MTVEQAKSEGFTHHAKMYGFKGYYYNGEDESHTTFQAQYLVSDWLVECMIYIEAVFGINGGFPILIGGKL